MAKIIPTGPAPRDIKAVAKAFFDAAASIPENQREAVIKAASMKVTTDVRAYRAKAAEQRAKARAKLAKAKQPKPAASAKARVRPAARKAVAPPLAAQAGVQGNGHAEA